MVRLRRKSIEYDKKTLIKKKYYSFLTIVLLGCILILLYSTILNISKIIAYQGKIKDLKKIQAETADKNLSLKKQLNDLDSRSYEAIARNNLKMSGEDEVLIIIHEPEITNDKNKKNKEKDKEKKRDNS